MLAVEVCYSDEIMNYNKELKLYLRIHIWCVTLIRHTEEFFIEFFEVLQVRFS